MWLRLPQRLWRRSPRSIPKRESSLNPIEGRKCQRASAENGWTNLERVSQQSRLMLYCHVYLRGFRHHAEDKDAPFEWETTEIFSYQWEPFLVKDCVPSAYTRSGTYEWPFELLIPGNQVETFRGCSRCSIIYRLDQHYRLVQAGWHRLGKYKMFIYSKIIVFVWLV